MLRLAVLSICLAAGVAHAERPTFTVDIEPDDSLGDRAANALTNAIRKLGAAKSSPYVHRGTKHAIFAAVADADCKLKQVACAVSIGERLGVDYFLGGEIVTRSQTFVVVLHVVNVKTKKRVRTFRDLIPRKGNMEKWAKVVFARALDATSGSIDIRSNARFGKVVVDGEIAAELYDQRTSILGLTLGTHSIEIDAKGYKPYRDEVVVDGATSLAILLEPLAPAP